MVLFSPGNEPEKLKKKITSFFQSIDELYPDKKVVGLHNAHKKLGERLTQLYRELGYENGAEMMQAYGYEYVQKKREAKSASQKREEQLELISKLKAKMDEDSIFESVADLKAAFPDLQKAIVNSHLEKQELIDVGILTTDPNTLKKMYTKRKREIIQALKERIDTAGKNYGTIAELKAAYPDLSNEITRSKITVDDLVEAKILKYGANRSEKNQSLLQEIRTRLNGQKLRTILEIKKMFPDLKSKINTSGISVQEFVWAGILLSSQERDLIKQEENKKKYDELIKLANGIVYRDYEKLKCDNPELDDLIKKYNVTRNILMEIGILKKEVLSHGTLACTVLIDVDP